MPGKKCEGNTQHQRNSQVCSIYQPKTSYLILSIWFRYLCDITVSILLVCRMIHSHISQGFILKDELQIVWEKSKGNCFNLATGMNT